VVLMGGLFAAAVLLALPLRPAAAVVETLAGAGVDAEVGVEAVAAALLLEAGRLLGSLRFSGWVDDCAQAELASRLMAEARSNGLIFICAPGT